MSKAKKLLAVTGLVFALALVVAPALSGTGLGGALAQSGVVLQANAQTPPTWDSTSTDAAVNPFLTNFKEAAVYSISTVAPFAMWIMAILAVIGFSVWLFHRVRRTGRHT